jgi:hypothetical protein
MTSSTRAPRPTPRVPKQGASKQGSVAGHGRNLHVVGDPTPTLGERFRDSRPAQIAALGGAVLVALVALSQVPKIGEAPGPDPRIEVNEGKEKSALASLFDAERGRGLPYDAEIGAIDQFRGSVRVQLDGRSPLASINLRTTPFMQRDLANGKIEDSNAEIKIGDIRADDEAIRSADVITLVDPLSVTTEDGTVFYGGVFTEPGQDPPVGDATEDLDAFADNVYWVNATALQEPHSGALVDITPGDVERTVTLHADPNFGGGPFVDRLPTLYVGESQ